MGLILVEHDTAAPALYGAGAAVVAAARGATLAHLPARFDTAVHPDAVQHAAASGGLVPSGLLWFERLTRRTVGPAATVGAILHDAALMDVVVPLHPALMPAADLAAALIGGATSAGVGIERLSVSGEGPGFSLWRRSGDGSAECLGGWTRDPYGRLRAAPPDPAPAAARDGSLRIGLIGAERDHRDVYPAALAALGDAADAAGHHVDVVFIAPTALRPDDVAERLAALDGVLLPGGAAMANVPGQILMARGAFDRGVPTVGLCLGMQTMATALAQVALGESGVNLAEADPAAPLHSFIPMAGTPSLPPHRLGGQATFPVPDTRYAALPGVPRRERFNHRYRLNPALVAPLARAGATVAAWDETGMVADAVEAKRHPFFIGLQGHPELTSHPGAPHPLLSAFLAACVGRAAPSPSAPSWNGNCCPDDHRSRPG